MDFRRERSTARPRGAVLAIGVAATVVMLTACSTAVPSGQAPQAPRSSHTPASGDAYVPQSGSMIWMLTRAALAQLIADPSTMV